MLETLWVSTFKTRWPPSGDLENSNAEGGEERGGALLSSAGGADDVREAAEADWPAGDAGVPSTLRPPAGAAG